MTGPLNFVSLFTFSGRREAQNFMTCKSIKLAKPCRLHDPRHSGAVPSAPDTTRKAMKAPPGLINEAGRKVTAAMIITLGPFVHKATLLRSVDRLGFLYPKSIMVGSVLTL